MLQRALSALIRKAHQNYSLCTDVSGAVSILVQRQIHLLAYSPCGSTSGAKEGLSQSVAKETMFWFFLPCNCCSSYLQIFRELCSTETVNLFSFCVHLCKDAYNRDFQTVKTLLFWACLDVPQCLHFCTCLFHKSS